jgi:hypothetical protein
VYTLRVICHNDTNLESVLCTLNTQRFVLPDPETGWFGKTNGRWFFRVPEDCETFSITFGGPPKNEGRSRIEIIRPDDHTSMMVEDLAYEETGTVTVEPKPEERGRVWALNLGARIVGTDGIPNWFANTPQGAVE